MRSGLTRTEGGTNFRSTAGFIPVFFSNAPGPWPELQGAARFQYKNSADSISFAGRLAKARLLTWLWEAFCFTTLLCSAGNDPCYGPCATAGALEALSAGPDTFHTPVARKSENAVQWLLGIGFVKGSASM